MMMTGSKTGFASLALLCGLGWLVVACPASLDDRCSDGACVASLMPEGGGDADAAGDAPMTDPCIDNPTDLKCLDEATALFVSAGGDDQDPTAGTRKAPLKTINAALAKIDAKRRRIYVCEGAYFEDLALNATHSSLSIFGGIDCAWNAAPAIKPVIGASANPLKIDGTQALALADIAIVAKDATAGSSIAAFVSGGDTTFKRVRLSAGKGADATDAVVKPFTNFPAQADLNGNSAPDATTGGAEKPYTCPGGQLTKGGKGGKPGDPGADGTPGPSNAGVTNNCTTDVTGKPGGAGANGAGATTPGELKADGWSATAGMEGSYFESK
jgi:hypothetical protein